MGRKMDRVGIWGEKQCHFLDLYLFFFLYIYFTQCPENIGKQSQKKS